MNGVLWMHTDAVSDPDVFGRAFDRMPPERQKKILAFRFEKDRRLSLCAGILLEEALRRADVRHARIAAGTYGKPFLADRADIHFNLTHSGQIAAIAVSDRPVGIDAERCQHFEDVLLQRVFLPSELAEALSDRDTFHTTLWTVKESLMKLLGTGLSLDPKDIRVSFFPYVHAYSEGYDCADLRFTTRLIDGHVLTVCSAYDPFADRFERFDLK